MKTKIFLQIIALCLTLSSCDSCKEKEWDILPPETQTGANTFGCYVNGELFVKDREAIFTEKRLRINYYKNNKTLIINALSNNRTIYITVNESEINVKNLIPFAYFMPSEYNSICAYFIGRETGEIVFTKLDTINCIVSGRFQFQGQCSDFLLNKVSDSLISVTNGRFDAKLYIY